MVLPKKLKGLKEVLTPRIKTRSISRQQTRVSTAKASKRLAPEVLELADVMAGKGAISKNKTVASSTPGQVTTNDEDDDWEDIEDLRAQVQELRLKLGETEKRRQSGIPILKKNTANKVSFTTPNVETPTNQTDVIISYVTGPNGQLIPVYGRPTIPASQPIPTIPPQAPNLPPTGNPPPPPHQQPPPPPQQPPPTPPHPTPPQIIHIPQAREPEIIKYPDDLNSLNIPILTFEVGKPNDNGKVYTNNIDMWVQQIDRETLGFKPLNICRAAHKHSEGQAWHKLGHLITMCEGKWDDIKAKLQATAYDLYTDGYATVVNNIMKIKREKGENVTTLHEKFRPHREKIAQKYPQFAETAEKLMIQTFAGLIGKRFQLKFDDKNKATFDDVYYMALEFDKFNPRTCTHEVSESETVTINAVSAEKHASSVSTGFKCHYCDQPGHIIKYCKLKQQHEGRGRGRGRGWYNRGRGYAGYQDYTPRGRGYQRGGYRGRYNHSNRGQGYRGGTQGHRGGQRNNGNNADLVNKSDNGQQPQQYALPYAYPVPPYPCPPYSYPPPNYPLKSVGFTEQKKKNQKGILKKNPSKESESEYEYETGDEEDSKNEQT